MLAGGRSRRIGRDKRLLPWDETTLLGHTVLRLRGAGFTPVVVGGSDVALPGIPTISDDVPAGGPAGGLEAALRSLLGSHQAEALFLPVDTPLLPACFLVWLWERTRTTGAQATIPMLGNQPQPLCAVYSAALAPRFRQALDAGERKVMRIVEGCVPPAALDQFRVEAVAASQGWHSVHRWFTNLNTPADWAALAPNRSVAATRGI